MKRRRRSRAARLAPTVVFLAGSPLQLAQAAAPFLRLICPRAEAR